MFVGRLLCIVLMGGLASLTAGERFNVTRVALERGLSPSVNAILQDELGFL